MWANIYCRVYIQAGIKLFDKIQNHIKFVRNTTFDANSLASRRPAYIDFSRSFYKVSINIVSLYNFFSCHIK